MGWPREDAGIMALSVFTNTYLTGSTVPSKTATNPARIRAKAAKWHNPILVWWQYYERHWAVTP
eukprot:6642636-Karenia_brevis.AAC.1